MMFPASMWNPWLDLSLKAIRLGWEAQTVIALRLVRLGFDQAQGRSAEFERMVREKYAVAVEAQAAAAAAALKGAQPHRMADRAMRVYRKRVRSNKRRLAR